MTVVVSAIVVTWNSSDVISNCLASLRRELPEGASEVIVVDNNSHDSTLQVVHAVDPDARVIANESNRGLAAANNQGMAAARGSHFLICNPDVVLHPGSVRSMVEVMGRHDRASWIVPRFVHEDGALQTSVGNLPTLAETILGRQAARRRSPGSPTGFWWDGWPHDTEQAVGRGFEPAYLIRRQAADEVGLQDERYMLDWEGLDWAERFQRAGWELWFAPEAEVVHLGGTSRRQVPFRSIVSQHRGMYRYYSDRRSWPWRPFLAVVLTTRAVLKLSLTRLGLPLYSWAHRDRRNLVGSDRA
jgi:GT2 family glycosyltransferase